MRFSIDLAKLLLATAPHWPAQALSAPHQETAGADVQLRGSDLRDSGGEAPSVEPPRRELMAGHDGAFKPLSCNDGLTVDDCDLGVGAVSFRDIVDAGAGGEARVPCGVCAVVDYAEGEVVEIPRGINVEGMLYFPDTASVELRVPHLFVQGILKIDAPAAGNAVKVHLTEDSGQDQWLIPHEENAGACIDGCNYQRKAFAVAGGTLDIQGLPDPSCPTWTSLEAVLDEDQGTNQVLKVGSEAAACWSRRLGDELLITDTVHVGVPYKSLTGTIQSADVEAGTVTLASPPLDRDGIPSAGYISTLANDPDFPAEVAWLSRSVVFDADVELVQGNEACDWCHLHCEKEKTRGGHMIIDHTSGVAQMIEGAEFRNFGQGGVLGRYPIHFHMCSDVSGSVVRKNLVRSSGQRCVVIHQSDNVTIEENVAFSHRGHCFMLEDGVEEGNVFRKNLGADGWRHSCVESVLGNKRDNRASTFWISNAHNEYIDNVAAGSINGFWFDMADGVPISTFRGNTAHSNLVEGIKLYRGGYRPNGRALLENTKSYRNYQQGVRLHVNKNIFFKGLVLADNGIGISSFDNSLCPDSVNGGDSSLCPNHVDSVDERIIFEDVRVIGMTEKSRELYALDSSGEALVDPYPVITWDVAHEAIIDNNHYVVDGIKFTHDPDFAQLVLRNISFSGFGPHPAPSSAAVEEYDILAMRLWGAAPGFHNAEGSTLQGGDKRFHDMPVLEGVFMDSPVNSFDIEQGYLEMSEKSTSDADVYLQDIDGTMHADGPGLFIVQNPPAIYAYLAEHVCEAANNRPNSVALFCPGACIRKVVVYSGCDGDLVVGSPSTGKSSAFPGTIAFGSTYKHVFFLPYDNYEFVCNGPSGEAGNPKYAKVVFDGLSHYFYSNFGFKGTTIKPPPACSPYIEESSFGLQELLLHQRYEGEGPVSYDDFGYNKVQFEADTIKLGRQRDITYGPINFGAPGETGLIRLRYLGLSSSLELTVTLEDGTILADHQSMREGGFFETEIVIDEQVEGVHEVTFRIDRFAGTHIMFELDWFELQAPSNSLQEHFDAKLALDWGSAWWYGNYLKMQVNNGWVSFGDVNFGEPGQIAVLRMRYSKTDDSGSLKARLGSKDATEFLDYQLLKTGSFDEFVEVDLPINMDGVHKLFFTAHRFAGTHVTVCIDWFELLPTPDYPLYQRFQAAKPTYWNVALSNYAGITPHSSSFASYWPVNFGNAGETNGLRVCYSMPDSAASLEARLGDLHGPVIATFGENTADWTNCLEQTSAIEDIEGLQKVTFTANRFAGTHVVVNLFWFELATIA